MTRPASRTELPKPSVGGTMLEGRERDVLSFYVRSPEGVKFLSIIERVLGKEVTTRTWDTVTKCASA